MTTSPTPRVVIDFRPNGDFSIYSDPEIEVICRSAHTPEDALYRYGSHPIPEEWLRDKRFGVQGDGSEADGVMQVIREARAGTGGA